MKYRTCAAADPSTILGLGLAGVKEVFIWTRSDDPSRLREWFIGMVNGGMGAMIISHDCAIALSRELTDKRNSGALTPIVVVVPGDVEDTRARGMLRRAIGMDQRPSSDGGKR